MGRASSDFWNKFDATFAAPLVTGPLAAMFSGGCLATIFAAAGAVSGGGEGWLMVPLAPLWGVLALLFSFILLPWYIWWPVTYLLALLLNSLSVATIGFAKRSGLVRETKSLWTIAGAIWGIPLSIAANFLLVTFWPGPKGSFDLAKDGVGAWFVASAVGSVGAASLTSLCWRRLAYGRMKPQGNTK